jgi:XRE family transcriptional regulator, aerobic/anaerobic benzoate catabolism transcriptional regulator
LFPPGLSLISRCFQTSDRHNGCQAVYCNRPLTKSNIVRVTASEESALLKSLAGRVREMRARRGLTLRALSVASKLSVRFLGQIEAARANVSVLKLARLATALGTTPAALLSVRRTSLPIICLLGLRGAGKTAVGRRLARKLRVPFVELDQRIEELAGLSLAEIFSIHGEAYYRRLERQTLERVLADERPLVLAAGGGLVTSADTFALVRQRTVTVWLRASAQDHWNRVWQQGDRRPSAGRQEALGELKRLLERREPLYAQATHTIDTSRLGLESTVRAIESKLAKARSAAAIA